MALVGEDELQMGTPRFIDHRLRNPIQQHQSIFPVFHHFTRNDEHRGVQFRQGNFSLPSELANLLFPAARINLEQAHAGQVIWERLEQLALFFPRKWVRLAGIGYREHLDQWRGFQPRASILITPQAGGQIQNASSEFTRERQVSTPEVSSCGLALRGT